MHHFREKNGMLALQYTKGGQALPVFITHKSRRQLIQSLQSQQDDGNRQRNKDSPGHQPE